MRNHDEKVRQMVRSLLPSSARFHTRKRKRISAQRARAANRARLSRLMEHLHDLDGFEEPLHHYDRHDTGWDGMVDDRRARDKAAPIARWAAARIDRDARLLDGDYWTRRCHFAPRLGDTVAGRHARQHLDWHFGELDPYRYGWSWAEREAREEERRKLRRAAAELRARKLDLVLEGAGPRRLNARIEALTPPVVERIGYTTEGIRIVVEELGCVPWLLEGERPRWLATGRSGPTPAQRIAYEALDEVYAEMFGFGP